MFVSCLQAPLHVALNLAGAQAAGAYVQRGGGTVHDGADTLDVGRPGALRFADGMADTVTVHGLFCTDLAEFSHS